MLLLNTALESSEQPPLEQRGDGMNARHDFVSLFVPAADDRNVMLVACSREARIAFPPVGVNCRARLHGLSNEVQKAFGGNILDAFQPDAPDCATVFLCRDHDDGLFLNLAAPLALFRAANVGFIDFNLAGKSITSRSDHGPAQLVQPRPSRFVAAQAKCSLQTQGAHAILLAGYEPHREKPRTQRLVGVLEYCTSRQRRTAVAIFASKHPARRHPGLPSNPATLANETVRPAQAPDVVAALCLGPKPIVHFIERARVIDARGRACIFHGKKISASRTCVKGIPIYAIYTRRDRQAGGEEFKAARKIKDKTNKMRTVGIPDKNLPPNPNFPFQHVGDIIATTAVCLYPSDIDTVRDFIFSKAQESILQIHHHEPKEEGGYRAYHFVAGLTDPKYAGIRCEVQLKTIVHDAWTAWTHDLTYKPKGPLHGDIKGHMKDLSEQLTIVERMSLRFRDSIQKVWDRESRRKETVRQGLLKEILLKPPQGERIEAYLHIAQDLVSNENTHRSGDVSRVVADIKRFAGNAPDLYSSQLLVYLAALRAQDDLDYVALEMIDEWVFRVEALERVKALNFKGLALYGLNRIPEAIDVAEKVLQETESLSGGPFVLPRQNLAHYLAEMGGKPDSHGAEHARALADEAMTIAESKNNVTHSLLDTVGFVKIVFGRDQSEIREGGQLCRRAYNDAPQDSKDATQGFLQLHEEIEQDRLRELEQARNY